MPDMYLQLYIIILVPSIWYKTELNQPECVTCDIFTMNVLLKYIMSILKVSILKSFNVLIMHSLFKSGSYMYMILMFFMIR